LRIESVIISFMYSILCKLQDAYHRSFTHSLLESFATKTKRYFDHSIIWNFARRKGKIAQGWEDSLVLKVLTSLINLPSKLLRPVYLKFEKVFSASIIIKILNLLLSPFTFILGICLAVIVAIPDHRWYNKYSVIMLLFLTVLFTIKTIIQHQQQFNLKPLELPLFIFGVSVIFAAINSALPKTSLSYLILYAVAFMFLILIISSISSFRELDSMIEVLLLGVAFTALYGIYQWKIIGIPVNPSITDTRLSPGLSRISSTMGNENVYGELLVLTIPFFISSILNSKTLVKRLFFGALFVPVLLALFLTGSRSAWISFAASIFVFIFLKNRKLIPLALLVGVLSIPMLPDSIYRRIMTLFNPHDNSAKYRTLIFEHAKPMLMDYWTTGVGLGSDTFTAIFKRYLSFKLPTAAHTHNLYLQLWLELGIVGIISFMWFLFRTLKNSLIRVFSKDQKQDSVKNVLIAGTSALSGILVMALADHIWFYNRLMLMFWVVVGIVLACQNILNNEVETSESSYT
jgi:putative inorganic carbon (HCO3(-)) transporter